MSKEKNEKQNAIFFHVSEQELSPSESKYENVANIKNYEDNSIDNIILQDTCDYLVANDIKTMIDAMHTKLKNNGKIYLQGSDMKQLCVAVTFDMVAESIIKKVLYPNKKSIHNMGEIIALLKDSGFKIIVKKYINVFEYYIEAVKNA